MTTDKGKNWPWTSPKLHFSEVGLTHLGWATDSHFRIFLSMVFWWVPQWVMRWVGSCMMGHALGGVTCAKGHHMGGVMCLGHYMGGVMYGVTHLIMGPSILGRVPYVQSSLSDRISVAGRGRSKEGIWKSGPKKPWQPQTWQDLTRFFSTGFFATFCRF